MSEALFDIVFKGKFVRQIDQTKAVLHFSKLFKMPIEKAQIFFDGKARPLKKSLTLEKASHFRAALKKAGLRVSMAKQESANSPAKEESITLSEVGAVFASKPFIQPKHYDTSQFSIDELGVEIVHKEAVEMREFDLHELHVDKVGVTIVEKEEVPELDIDISDLSMEEVGAIFAEKQIIAEPDLDISELSMEEVGATLVEKKKIPEPEINIDNIEMAD